MGYEKTYDALYHQQSLAIFRKDEVWPFRGENSSQSQRNEQNQEPPSKNDTQGYSGEPGIISQSSGKPVQERLNDKEKEDGNNDEKEPPISDDRKTNKGKSLEDKLAKPKRVPKSSTKSKKEGSITSKKRKKNNPPVDDADSNGSLSAEPDEAGGVQEPPSEQASNARKKQNTGSNNSSAKPKKAAGESKPKTRRGSEKDS